MYKLLPALIDTMGDDYPVVVSSGLTNSVDVRLVGPGVSVPTSFNIPLNKIRGVNSCDVSVNYNY